MNTFYALYELELEGEKHKTDLHKSGFLGF